MGIFDVFRKKEKKQTSEESFRMHLLKNGRITDATITENETLESGKILVHYYYSVQGANFESSEILTPEQVKKSIEYAPGAKVGVRYDPKHHGSSVLV